MKIETIDAIRHDLNTLMAKLREERDEAKLQMHLAKAEIRDEWEKLEPKWEHFQSKVHEVGESAQEATDDVKAGLSILADELKDGYRRIKDAID